MDRSRDAAVNSALNSAEKLKVRTVWDRYEAQMPQCGFGETGLCCRNCMQGPCRIDPFGDGPQAGVCGANAGRDGRKVGFQGCRGRNCFSCRPCEAFGPHASQATLSGKPTEGLGYMLLFGIYGVIFLLSALALLKVKEPE